MGEILFRGKRVEEPIKINPYAPDGWVYGALIECDDGCFILPYDISGEMYIDRPYKFRANDVEARIMLANVGIETVGQYTGLKDKNGTKIFEGDIVKLSSEITLDDFDGFIGQVKFELGCFSIVNGYKGDSVFQDCRDVEVIGNIYDNQELLGGERC